jgi:hypothetical protein
VAGYFERHRLDLGKSSASSRIVDGIKNFFGIRIPPPYLPDLRKNGSGHRCGLERAMDEVADDMQNAIAHRFDTPA